jgi:predicted RecA/RadA family phage recombinase
MRNYVQDDTNIGLVAPSNVSSGGVVIAGALVGVALADALSGETVSVCVRGVVELPKKTADEVTLGVLLYWDAANGYVTTTPGTNSKPLIGVAAKASGAGAATAHVLLGAHGITGPSS